MSEHAHIDEGSIPLLDGSMLCALAAVVTEVTTAEVTRRQLRRLLRPGDTHLHHYDLPGKRRLEVAEALACIDISGAVVVTRVSGRKGQEAARRAAMSWLLPRLEHIEGVDLVIIESRHVSDKHDLRTRDRLRRSRALTGELLIEHRRKREDELLWIADFVVGSYLATRVRGEAAPWDALISAHVVEVHEL